MPCRTLPYRTVMCRAITPRTAGLPFLRTALYRTVPCRQMSKLSFAMFLVYLPLGTQHLDLCIRQPGRIVDKALDLAAKMADIG